MDVISAICQEVYNVLGKGHSEVVYHRAIEVELRSKGVLYESEVIVPIRYKDHTIGHFRLDLILRSRTIVELKALPGSIREDDKTQLANYLTQTGLEEGIIVNFNQKSSDIDVYIREEKACGSSGLQPLRTTL